MKWESWVHRNAPSSSDVVCMKFDSRIHLMYKSLEVTQMLLPFLHHTPSPSSPWPHQEGPYNELTGGHEMPALWMALWGVVTTLRNAQLKKCWLLLRPSWRMPVKGNQKFSRCIIRRFVNCFSQTHVCIPAPQLVVLFAEIMKPLGSRSLLNEVGSEGVNVDDLQLSYTPFFLSTSWLGCNVTSQPSLWYDPNIIVY